MRATLPDVSAANPQNELLRWAPTLAIAVAILLGLAAVFQLLRGRFGHALSTVLVGAVIVAALLLTPHYIGVTTIGWFK